MGTSAARYLLAVDGGNTKTIALVFEASTGLIGLARGGCADIYGARSPREAIDEIVRTSKAALESAGVAVANVDVAAFGLAGADWPEDFELLESELGKALPVGERLWVVNDAVGALWTGSDDGQGVSAAVGTGASVSASGPAGTWNSSHWSEPAGAVHLAESALRMVCRAELGTGPATALREGMLAQGGFTDVEEMLHHYTCRDRPFWTAIASFVPVILDVAEAGDEVAGLLVREQGEAVSRSVRVGVQRAGLPKPYDLVLTGGVFTHRSSLMVTAICDWLPDARPIVTKVEPAVGIAFMAAAAAGADLDREATVTAVECAVQAATATK